MNLKTEKDHVNEKAIEQSINKYKEVVNKEFLLNPISQHDKDIVLTLVDLCKKRGINGVEQVMENYKMHPDTEILEGLVKLGKTVKEEKQVKRGRDIEIVDEDEKENFFTMVKFKDFNKNRIFKPNIISYFKVDADEGDFLIVLNECDETLAKKPFHANLLLEYKTEEDRDEDFNMLDEYYD